MFKLINISFQEFHFTYSKHLIFIFIYLYLTSLLFVPILSYFFTQISKAIGIGELLNIEAYQIGLSTSSTLAIVLISFVAIMILFIEFGVMIMIAQQTYFNRGILISDAIATMLRRIPSLIGYAVIQLVFIVLLLIPFTDSLASQALGKGLAFLNNLFQGMSKLVILLFAMLSLMAIVIFFIVRWVFTLHYIFIEQKTVFQAMAESWQHTKHNQVKLIVKLVLFNLVVFLTCMLMLTGLSYLPHFTEMNVILEIYFITIVCLIAIIFLLLFIPVNITIITKLFYRFKINHNEPADDLIVRNTKSLTTFESSVPRFFRKKKFILVPVIMYVTCIYIINETILDKMVYLTGNIQVASHRGDIHTAPENSLRSIKAAIDQFVDAVEIDVMLTEDDVIVLNHDATFARVAGVSDTVAKMSYEEVAKVDIGQLFSKELSGEKVPTLDEALELMKKRDIVVIIDIKLSDLSRSEKMAQGVVELIEHHQMEEMVYVQSFKIEPVQEIRKLNRDIKIGQLLYLSTGDFTSLDVDFYAIRQTLLTERFVEIAHSMDREVWVWTVNLPWDIREVLKYDIDGIITDYPERVQRMK